MRVRRLGSGARFGQKTPPIRRLIWQCAKPLESLAMLNSRVRILDFRSNRSRFFFLCRVFKKTREDKLKDILIWQTVGFPQMLNFLFFRAKFLHRIILSFQLRCLVSREREYNFVLHEMFNDIVEGVDKCAEDQDWSIATTVFNMKFYYK